MVIDYRSMNALTIKNRYMLPRIEDLFDSLGLANYFRGFVQGYSSLVAPMIQMTKADMLQCRLSGRSSVKRRSHASRCC
jgi:hypothetical protein